jgi:hypothetical protein
VTERHLGITLTPAQGNQGVQKTRPTRCPASADSGSLWLSCLSWFRNHSYSRGLQAGTAGDREVTSSSIRKIEASSGPCHTAAPSCFIDGLRDGLPNRRPRVAGQAILVTFGWNTPRSLHAQLVQASIMLEMVAGSGSELNTRSSQTAERLTGWC